MYYWLQSLPVARHIDRELVAGRTTAPILKLVAEGLLKSEKEERRCLARDDLLYTIKEATMAFLFEYEDVSVLSHHAFCCFCVVGGFHPSTSPAKGERELKYLRYSDVETTRRMHMTTDSSTGEFELINSSASTSSTHDIGSGASPHVPCLVQRRLPSPERFIRCPRCLSVGLRDFETSLRSRRLIRTVDCEGQRRQCTG